jgi:hypothetical protein
MSEVTPKHPGGRPPKFKTPEEMQEAIDSYFKERELAEKPITISGLALALDVCRQTIQNYEVLPEFLDTIKRAKLRVEQYAEEKLYTGPATGPIFALKNFGWRDSQDVNLGGQNGENPIVTESQVTLEPSEAYKKLLG